MTADTNPTFEVTSYIGSEIAQFKAGGEKPPKSARLVASLFTGAGPDGGDDRTYLLSHDHAGWTLWQKGSDYDTGEELYCYVAYGSPHQGISEKLAAETLLTKTLEEEILEGLLASELFLTQAGILDGEDIARIEIAITADNADDD
jgi:hypothetical protein